MTVVDAFAPPPISKLNLNHSFSTSNFYNMPEPEIPMLKSRYASSCPALNYKVGDTGSSSVASIVGTDEESIESYESIEFTTPSQILNPHFSLVSQLNVNREMVRINPMSDHRPKVVGHRGSLYRSLENTRHSIRLAAEGGCYAVEIDVFLLKCGSLIVFHGGGSDQNPGCLKDYCNKDASILDLTYQEARQLKFNPHYQEFGCGPDMIEQLRHECYIPTLEEVLQDAKHTGVTIKIELKGPGTSEPVLELVERLNMVSQVHYSSFDHSRIKRVRELRPQRGFDGTHVYKTGALYDEVPDDFIERALAVGATEVHLKYSTCTKDRVNKIHDAGMDSMIWMRGPIGMEDDTRHRFHDVEDEDEIMYQIIMATGVKAMCVNKPDVLLNLLLKQNK